VFEFLCGSGRTFCTVISFKEVVKAIAEVAFVTSDLPVLLSLEMHCSPKQQNRIAHAMVEAFGTMLLTVSTLTFRVLCSLLFEGEVAVCQAVLRL
jgi:hypothetical protein